MGLGVVQKAWTRQIDASEIIGKAGSSEFIQTFGAVRGGHWKAENHQK